MTSLPPASSPSPFLPITASTLTCLFTWFCGFNLDVVRERWDQRTSSPADSSTSPGQTEISHLVLETKHDSLGTADGKILIQFLWDGA